MICQGERRVAWANRASKHPSTEEQKALPQSLSLRHSSACFHLVESLAEPLQYGLHRFVPGTIEELERIVALVKQLLLTIPLVADVDIVILSQRDEWTSSSGRSTSTGIGRIRFWKLGDCSITIQSAGSGD
jgi:hypothetical protein